MNLCAVSDCPNEGKPHVCPYDYTRHHHGRIHYGREDYGSPPGLTFREGWHLVCDEHYAVLRKAREDWEAWKRTGWSR